MGGLGGYRQALLTLVAGVDLPHGVRLSVTGVSRSGAPYNIQTGRDTDGR